MSHWRTQPEGDVPPTWLSDALDAVRSDLQRPTPLDVYVDWQGGDSPRSR
jgi:hypothetical protein